jgi:hypothetical protein
MDPSKKLGPHAPETQKVLNGAWTDPERLTAPLKMAQAGQPPAFPLAAGSAIRAQVLVFEPALTHSVWQDFESRARTRDGLERQLRNGVCAGRFVGYRLLRIETQHIGRTWPNAAVTDAEPQAKSDTRAQGPRSV